MNWNLPLQFTNFLFKEKNWNHKVLGFEKGHQSYSTTSIEICYLFMSCLNPSL